MSVSVHVELDHDCRVCWHVSAATVMGVGVDEAAAEEDAASLIRMARCPRCKRRNPTVRTKQRQSMIMLVLGFLVVGFFGLSLAADDMFPELLTALIAGPFGIGLTAAVALGVGLGRRSLMASERRVKFSLPASGHQGPYRSRT